MVNFGYLWPCFCIEDKAWSIGQGARAYTIGLVLKIKRLEGKEEVGIDFLRLRLRLRLYKKVGWPRPHDVDPDDASWPAEGFDWGERKMIQYEHKLQTVDC